MPDARFPFRRMLMLQGPVGPFFRLLGRHLRRHGVEVWKVNLNSGDAIYFPGPNALAYRGPLEGWRAYLQRKLRELNIDSIALFGDYRVYHSTAITVARDAGIPVFVFEEGYVRPDYVTVELNGVNGKSGRIVRRSRDAVCFAASAQIPANDPGRAVRVGNTFPALVLHCMVYWSFIDLGWPLYRYYRHHKPRSLAEIKPWLLSAFRKLRYARRDSVAVARLYRGGAAYFLVPLQVHRDGQVMRDSGFLSVGHFIVTVMESFAKHAPVDQILVLKQHPMDRGFTDYTALVAHTAARLGCADRVMYIRDTHLPTLLRKARGTLAVNSTVGLSSLIHGTPVMVLGRAIYDQPGLTVQGSLRDFWTANETVDAQRVRDFTGNLIERCQANGSFYRRRGRTGLVAQAARQMAKQYVLRSMTVATAKAPRARPVIPELATLDAPRAPGGKRSGRPDETVH